MNIWLRYLRKVKPFIFTLLLLPMIIQAQAVTASNATTTSTAPLSDKAQTEDTSAIPYPSINYNVLKNAEQVKRGEYLVKMGDCIACHTQRGGNGKPFAGDYPVITPFGTIYTPNITPDKKTGIGTWSLADFMIAMREGHAPPGHGHFHYYYPAFPYLYFNKLTDVDLQDMKAYLDAIPAVEQTHQKNTMMFPFNVRITQLGWQMMFFKLQKTGPYQPDPQQSAAWNRGAYLVKGLGHCDMCHTPMYYLLSRKLPLGAPIMKYHLAGAQVQGFYAPNITSSGLEKYTDQQISNVFLKDQLLEGGAVQGLMADANHNSFQYLHPEDLKAIITYLRTVKSKTPPKINVGTGLAGGKKTFDQYCAGCHLSGAAGAPKLGDTAAWAPLAKRGMDELYKNAINGIGSMPAKGTCTTCTTQEIQDAVQYMVHESTGEQATKAAPKGAAPKQLTLSDGQHIYESYCAVCHNGSYPGAPKLGDKTAWAPLIKPGMDILILNTLHGKNNMPARGGCKSCNDAELIAAVKYMVQSSKTQGNYILW